MDIEIYKRAIETWGNEAQTEMLVEECSEVIMAIQKLKRAYYSDDSERLYKTMNNVCEELADLSIMLEQMMFVFNPETINQFKIEKLDRLKSRLDNYNKK